MSDQEVKFKFDLDAKDAMSSLSAIKDKILELGESKGVKQLVSGFTELAGPIAVAGAALFAVKKAFDFSVEGEAVLRIEQQFKSMAETAGLSADEIQEGMIKATRGTVATADAMKSATRSMTLLGEQASQIPQIMELSRKAGLRFGMDTLDAFEKVSLAIATGNQQQLRQLGIVLDLEAAEIKYGNSLGKTKNALTESETRQARLNAILEQGNEKYKNAITGVTTLSLLQKQISTTWHEMGEVIAAAVNKMFGPAFQKALEYFKSILEETSNTLKSKLGHGLEKTNAQIALMTTEIERMESALARAKKTGFLVDKGMMIQDTGEGFKFFEDKIKDAKSNLTLLKDDLHNAMKAADLDAARNKKPDVLSDKDKAKQLDEQNKFQKEMLKLKETRLASELSLEDDNLEYLLKLEEKKMNVSAQFELEKSEIKSRRLKGEIATEAQAAMMIEQINETKKNAIKELDLSADDSARKAYENKLKYNKSIGDGIVANAKIEAETQKKTLQDGTFVYNSLRSGAVRMFKAIGDGSKNAGEAFKEFMFGALGEFATKKGEVMLASGIGDMNPVQIAEGGALITLGAAISAMAGSGGGGGSTTSGGGSVGGSYGGGIGITSPSYDSEQRKKTVTIQVQGNYFETDQTKRTLLDMIRSETDATNYKYEQIPVR